MENKTVEILMAALAVNGIKLTESQIHKFSLYTVHLLKVNSTMNLTAVTDPKGIAIKHYYDSILPFLKLSLQGGETILDIGSGAGFPAIPLKIAMPELNITMADSLNKRVLFLRECIELLELKNARAIHTRAEDIPFDMREGFDIVTARAVAPLNILCEYSLPFVKKGGRLIALKGQKGEQELKQAKRCISILGGEFTQHLSFELPESMGNRQIYVITKISQTPTQYPRKAVDIKKKPL